MAEPGDAASSVSAARILAVARKRFEAEAQEFSDTMDRYHKAMEQANKARNEIATIIGDWEADCKNL